MPLSYNQYTGDGSTRAFNLDFDYIAKEHIEVRVDGSSVPYTWLDTYRVQTVTAPASGTIVEVRRRTPRDEILVEFMDGSVLVETDLNLATIQSFFLAQEAFDQGEASLAVTSDGHYSAGLRRITLVADPVNDRDVVTKQWALSAANTNLTAAVAAKNASEAARDISVGARDTALTHRNVAASERSLAEAARSGSEAARDAAVTARNTAQSAASTATTERTAAQTARTGAETARSGAEAAQSAAQAARSAAELARDKAQEWADKPEDSAISPGVFSARHWAAKAMSAANALLGDLGNAFHGAGAKASPADADEFGFSDSAAGWSLKKMSWANLKTALASVFIGLTGTQQVNGLKRFTSNLTGISHATGAGTMIEAFSTSSNAAGIALHRSGVFACYFGIDTDNQLKVGGWSMGNNAYRIWHEGNLNPISKGGDTLSAGYQHTPHNLGTISSGTVTLSIANGHMQYYQNAGAHTLAPPNANGISMGVRIQNVAGAGAISISANKVTGDPLTTTNGHIFHVYFTRIASQTHAHVTRIV